MPSPLVLFHDATGVLDAVTSLAARIVEGRVLGIERRIAGPVRELPDLVAGYLARLEQAGLRPPWRFGGFSFGGTLAFEGARIMTERGQDVGLLAIIDAEPPQSNRWKTELEVSINGLVEALRVQSGTMADIFAALDENPLDFDELTSFLPHSIANAIPPHRRARPVDSSRAIKNILECVDMLSRYSPFTKAQPDLTVCIRSRGAASSNLAAWRELVQGPYEEIEVPGDHQTILRGQGLELIATRLNRVTLHAQRVA